MYKLVYVGPVCIGVGKETAPGYHEMICNSILPETDADYEKEKKKIEGDMQLIADTFNGSEQGIWVTEQMIKLDSENYQLKKEIEKLKEALEHCKRLNPLSRMP